VLSIFFFWLLMMFGNKIKKKKVQIFHSNYRYISQTFN
jgi:hypothetical protein